MKDPEHRPPDPPPPDESPARPSGRPARPGRRRPITLRHRGRQYQVDPDGRVYRLTGPSTRPVPGKPGHRERFHRGRRRVKGGEAQDVLNELLARMRRAAPPEPEPSP